MPAANPALYLARLKELARARGGVLLSPEYLNDWTKLRFRCAEGHEWEATPGKIYLGRWCPVCGRVRGAGLRRAPAEARLRRIVAERGGEFLSPRYVNSWTHHRFRCAEGHEWDAVPNSLTNGSWCPACARANRALASLPRRFPPTAAELMARALAMKPALDRLESIARSKGGVALTESYGAQDAAMAFRCARGHEFEARPVAVYRGSWCPACKDVERLERVQAAAAARGGRCVGTRCHHLNDVLEFECAHGHRWRTHAGAVARGHWCRRCYHAPRRTIEQYREIARAHGGACLSTRYVNDDTPLRFRCAEGHVWSARPNSVSRGTWCRRCSRGFGRSRARLSLELMHEIAAERGGRCLSDQYRGIYDRLRWRCARGHEWVTPANNVRRGGWCPRCSRGRASSLAVMRELAEELGGSCLTRDWKDFSQSLTFRCARGHRFALNANYLKAGVWCPRCRPRPVASR